MFAGQRKNALKSFKQSVAAVIEAGELAEWIENIQDSELNNYGGEAGRLFQLLVEGKKANLLLVDSAALTKGAARSDLFSKKQCKTLQDRAIEVESQILAETELAVAL